MSSAMNKAMLAMSLEEEEDIPFKMSNLPQYCSSERNQLSLIGRLLNPDEQKLSTLIVDLPRKWQKVDKIRGVALNREKFQFQFKTEHDLEDVLEKGFQTYMEWGLALERWVEKPPPEYLQFVPIWVQISNIPVNHYTEEAITELGDIIGKVIMVAFDPVKSKTRGFVRVRVLFNVSKPLRKSKVIILPDGEATTVHFFYEKVQMRCTHCQRLTHSKDSCPFLHRQRSESHAAQGSSQNSQRQTSHHRIPPSDPLFGVLNDNQTGINPATGRPRISPEVLAEMRQYLLAATDTDGNIRMERIKKSVKEAEDDPYSRRIALQLEDPPLITHDLNKGKGIVFGYDSEDSSTQSDVPRPSGSKLLQSAIVSGPVAMDIPKSRFPYHATNFILDSSAMKHSTVYRFESFRAEPAGVFHQKSKQRKRPNKGARKFKARSTSTNSILGSQQSVSQSAIGDKRKAEVTLEVASKAAKLNASVMVPKEGPSKA